MKEANEVETYAVHRGPPPIYDMQQKEYDLKLFKVLLNPKQLERIRELLGDSDIDRSIRGLVGSARQVV